MNRLTYKAGIGTFSNETIVLGRVGEHLAQAIVFDCSAFAQLYGMGTAVLYARLPSGEKYPVPVVQDGSTVTWAVRAADLGTAGLGRGELQWIVNDAVAKTQVFRTRIRKSLTGTDVESPPVPYQDWVDSVTQRSETAASAATANAAAAEASAGNAAQSAQTAAASETAAVAAKNRTEEVVSTYEALPGDFNRLYASLLDGSVPVPMLDSDGEPILDSSGEALLGREALASAGDLDALETYLRQQLTLAASKFSSILERLDRMQTELDTQSE